MHVGYPDIYPTYAIPILAALLLGALYPVARHITDSRQKREYYFLQLITFLSAVAGARWFEVKRETERGLQARAQLMQALRVTSEKLAVARDVIGDRQ